MKRRLPHVDTGLVLQRLSACRLAMVDLRAGSPPRSLSRAAADQMIQNIDELAWLITGERDAFVTKAHGGGGRSGGRQGPDTR